MMFMSVLFLAETLLDLMSKVVRMCPSVCESSHFAVLLGTYSATLSVLGEEDLMTRLCGRASGVYHLVYSRAQLPETGLYLSSRPEDFTSPSCI